MGYQERPFGLKCQQPLKKTNNNKKKQMLSQDKKALKKERTSINRDTTISPLLKGIAEAVFVLNSSIF